MHHHSNFAALLCKWQIRVAMGAIALSVPMHFAQADPNYAEFWGATQGKISGSVTQRAREESTLLRHFKINADKSTTNPGLTGAGTLVLGFELGKESIALTKAASNHEVLKQILIHIWRPSMRVANGGGTEENVANLRFSNAVITNIALTYEANDTAALRVPKELQELTLRYEGVELQWTASGLTAVDGTLGPLLGAAAPAPPPPPASTPLSGSTLHATVANAQVNRYSASVGAGTYVVSATGIVGAAKLGVFSDAALTQAVDCISPNLENSTFSQPADCSFDTTGGTVYASVTGTGAGANSYNIRISPRYDATTGDQGTLAAPLAIPTDKPYGASATGTSYYMVNTRGTGDAVISMTGLTVKEGLDMSVYDQPGFTGALNNPNCYTGERATFPESCAVPAGKTYYIRVIARPFGGPFTLMVDSPPGTPAQAVPAPSGNVMQQVLPGSGTAP